jgi:hypothetical protein
MPTSTVGGRMGCEHCKLANMVDDARRHPSVAIVRDARVKLARIKAYERAAGTCPVHSGGDRGYRESAMLMEHWLDRIERAATRRLRGRGR